MSGVDCSGETQFSSGIRLQSGDHFSHLTCKHSGGLSDFHVVQLLLKTQMVFSDKISGS